MPRCLEVYPPSTLGPTVSLCLGTLKQQTLVSPNREQEVGSNHCSSLLPPCSHPAKGRPSNLFPQKQSCVKNKLKECLVHWERSGQLPKGKNTAKIKKCVFTSRKQGVPISQMRKRRLREVNCSE